MHRSKHNGFIVSLLIAFSLSGICTGQPYLFNIQKLTVQDGLPSRMGYSIGQDTDGFIWVSTLGGLSRYDGYQFKTYDASMLGVSSEFYISFFFDTQQNIWFSGNGAGNLWKVFDRKTEQVVSLQEYLGKGSDLPFDFKTFKGGAILPYLSTQEGEIYSFDGSFKLFYHYPYPGKHDLRYFPIKGTYSWGATGDTLLKFKDNRLVDQYILNREIYNVQAFRGDTLLLTLYKSHGGFYDGRDFWKFIDGKLERMPLLPSRPNTCCEDLNHAVIDSEGFGWFVVGKSLLGLDENNHVVFDKYIDELTGSKNGQPNFVQVFVDKNDVLWATTNDNILKITKNKNRFTTYLPGQSTRGIFPSGDSLFVYSYRHQAIVNLQTGQLSAKWKGNGVESMDAQGNSWIGLEGRNVVYKYPPASNKPIKIPSDSLSDLGESIVPFFDATTGKIFIGTVHGLGYVDTASQMVRHFQPGQTGGLENASIYHFHPNRAGLWIATDQGLFQLDTRRETLVRHIRKGNGLPFNQILFIHEDAQGFFWLGSKGGGLTKWDPRSNEFRQFTTAEGLSNNTVYAVYEDDYQQFWLPSDLGLMRFDKKTGNVKVFMPQDGLPNEEFNKFSHFRAKDGSLYFGGIGGVVRFHPEDFIKGTDRQSPLRITGLFILEAGKQSITDYSLRVQHDREIRLTPGDKLFELRFSLLDYSNPEANRYAYRMEGYDKHWHFIHENFIRINNMPYGTYRLKIKGQNSNGIWSENELSIPLIVMRPFYLRWWFLTGVALCLVTLTFLAVRWRIRQLEKDKIRLENEVAKRTLQIQSDKETIEQQAAALRGLDQVKTRFFTNITHELRTPLTLIIGPLEQLVQEKIPALFQRRLGGVLKNARQLLDLINQLLDLSKMEAGRMQIEYTRGDIVALTREITGEFRPLAGKKQQRLAFVSSHESWETGFDLEKWNKIVFNLLSNAIKFTPANGTIQVSISRQMKAGDEQILLSVKDTGTGIPGTKLPFVFDRFYQADNSSTRSHEGTGIGLALVKELVEIQGGSVWVTSEINRGTTFDVVLPVLKGEIAKAPAPQIPPVFVEIPLDNLPALVAESAAPADRLELLLIEDNDEMREYIRYCLDATRYNITEVRNGEEGLEKALTIVPDLIISDLMMPKMDGFALTQAIRSNLSTSHIPLILLTAKASLENRLEGLRRGADAYLTKPFSPQELTLRIEKLIELRQLLQQRYQNNTLAFAVETYEQEDAFILELKAYILQHLDEANLDGDTIGRHFGMSRVHLYRKLKALTDKSISDLVRQIRLEKALELVRQGKLTIAEISYQTGFSSPSFFTRSFKQAFGKTPSKM